MFFKLQLSRFLFLRYFFLSFFLFSPLPLSLFPYLFRYSLGSCWFLVYSVIYLFIYALGAGRVQRSSSRISLCEGITHTVEKNYNVLARCPTLAPHNNPRRRGIRDISSHLLVGQSNKCESIGEQGGRESCPGERP
ncbi:hypothetical protein B9Z19DRAFT_1078648 [Tuber borchii]|uniref:Uncharacterized protein n=1 Tax=Tuber borchii TaxID=42251 RepID=A0A2T6ZZ73_TUBBO|nr:hypothetical protein B9Z19DRAFT_1078648 [Tuber borchii]